MMTLDELISALTALRVTMPSNAPVYMEHEHPYANERARSSIEGIRVEGFGEGYGICLESPA